MVDTYNDFLSPEGAAWPLVKLVAERNHTVKNLLALVTTARNQNIKLAFAPHHRYHGTSHKHRKYLHPAQYQQIESQAFARGTFGGDFYQGLGPLETDILAAEHSCSSGFAETDLHDQLQQNAISHLLIGGCISNSCIEATARNAVYLGYHVSIITDAIAAFSPGGHELAVNHSLKMNVHRCIDTSQALQELKMNKVS